MERLTQHLPVENNPDVTCAFADCNADNMPGCDGCNLKTIANRLAAYEDTGLTPEQVARFRWIPVAERLPDPKDMDNITVLVCQRSVITNRVCVMSVARWNGSDWICKGKELSRVTHWMPLPEPPKEE